MTCIRLMLELTSHLGWVVPFSKKILHGILVVLQGILLGLSLNVLWHAILAYGAGWGDTAPDWYFRIQGVIFSGILLLGLAAWITAAPRVGDFLTGKKPKNTPLPSSK